MVDRCRQLLEEPLQASRAIGVEGRAASRAEFQRRLVEPVGTAAGEDEHGHPGPGLVDQSHGTPGEDVVMSQPVVDRLVSSLPRRIARLVLGAFLISAGVSHLSFARTPFYAQVPPWLPLKADLVVITSGVVEIALGASLVLLTRWRVPVGWVVAVFFVLVFPGNISQFVTHADAFGLDSDLAWGIRLLFQPQLVIWALWCTGAWVGPAEPRSTAARG